MAMPGGPRQGQYPMTTPFQTKGDVAQWVIIREELRKLEIGDLLTYDHLETVLGWDIRDNRTPLYKAAKEWGAEFHRALLPVTGEGYRVAEPTEHEHIARSQHRRSRRALDRGARALQNADRGLLKPEDRSRFDAMETNIARQRDMMKRLSARVEVVEKTLAADRKARSDLETTVQDQANRLARLEAAQARLLGS